MNLAAAYKWGSYVNGIRTVIRTADNFSFTNQEPLSQDWLNYMAWIQVGNVPAPPDVSSPSVEARLAALETNMQAVAAKVGGVPIVQPVALNG